MKLKEQNSRSAHRTNSRDIHNSQLVYVIQTEHDRNRRAAVQGQREIQSAETDDDRRGSEEGRRHRQVAHRLHCEDAVITFQDRLRPLNTQAIGHPDGGALRVAAQLIVQVNMIGTEGEKAGYHGGSLKSRSKVHIGLLNGKSLPIAPSSAQDSSMADQSRCPRPFASALSKRAWSRSATGMGKLAASARSRTRRMSFIPNSSLKPAGS